MAFTTDDLTVIETAIKSGTLKVRHSSGHEVTYQSMADLLAVRRTIRAELAAAALGGTISSEPRHQLASFADV